MPATASKTTHPTHTTKAAPAATPKTAHLAAQPHGTGKAVGKAVNRVLVRYEKNVARFVALEHKAAKSARFDWAKSALDLHATFIEDLSAVYVKTTRAALN